MKNDFSFRHGILGMGGLICFIAAALCLSPAELFAEDYAAALKRAKAEDKALVLYFYSKYCPYCVAMERDVLADREIANIMKFKVVSLRIDVEARPDLATKYGIRGYPSTCFMEPSGKVIIRVPGYVDKKEFGILLEYAKEKHYKTTALRDYLKKAGVKFN
ncbi:MAG: thioredoxin family protein [Syntrophobacterales bacterium]|jgi:thioredoxin-related protein|nr:thioredoxin family protein [Syntrophobacterales bacterium]